MVEKKKKKRVVRNWCNLYKVAMQSELIGSARIIFQIMHLFHVHMLEQASFYLYHLNNVIGSSNLYYATTP